MITIGKILENVDKAEKQFKEERKRFFTYKKTVTIPAGDYYLGDPSYTLSKSDWEKFTNRWLEDKNAYPSKNLNYPNDKNPLALSAIEFSPGKFCVAFTTGWGDGCWPDNKGNDYGVDSGTLALVDARLVSKDSLINKKGKEDLMTKFHFDNPVTVTIDNGFARIGDGIEINLKGDI